LHSFGLKIFLIAFRLKQVSYQRKRVMT
jgi:hypothetical protein